MSEFLDFLKHDYAYVAIGEFKPGKFLEAQQLFEKAVSTYRHGFKGAYLLQEENSDRGIAVIFWENIDDMASNRNTVCDAVLGQMAHLFAQPPHCQFYQVSSQVTPERRPQAIAA